MEKVSTHAATPMARALESTAGSPVLRAHRILTFRNGRYSYRVVRQGDRSIYSVSDGVKTISEPILYPFGLGKVGQTYLFRHNGRLFESRVTYYRTLDGLDFTGGQPRSAPASVEDALGRLLGAEDAQGCFGCHAPLSVTREGLKLENLVPGITCESCHGPGADHVAAAQAGKFDDAKIFNPGKLSATSLSQEFCGFCHRGFDQVMLMPGQGGINNLRFQPYRIFNSRGHNTADSRISCVACHDPHVELQHSPAYYDARCMACHAPAEAGGETPARAHAATCTVGKRDCAGCHMPKIEVPEMHFKFTDHWIRVVKPDAPVPK